MPGSVESEAQFGCRRGRMTQRDPVLSTILLVIRAYRYFISPFIPPSCRFYPSCSEYALQALYRFGILNGLWLSLKRLLKCQPFHKGGVDLVPEIPKSACIVRFRHHG